jgi:hypothetical protein
MTFHLFETEFKTISALNGEALRWFSIGTFLLSIVANIIVSYSFASLPISEGARFVFKFGLVLTDDGTILSFIFGFWSVWTKKTIIDDIKKETEERR